MITIWKKFYSLFISIMLVLCLGCGGSGDSTGPSDNPFPVNYTGTFRFTSLPYEFSIEFTILDSYGVIGKISGTDPNGTYYDFNVTGMLTNNSLNINITGEYGPPTCQVNGQATGTSSDNYQRFTGTWSYTNCVGITFTGTWDAHKNSA
jgi:hypothetical protein